MASDISGFLSLDVSDRTPGSGTVETRHQALAKTPSFAIKGQIALRSVIIGTSYPLKTSGCDASRRFIRCLMIVAVMLDDFAGILD
jgi:hypothetical protein